MTQECRTGLSGENQKLSEQVGVADPLVQGQRGPDLGKPARSEQGAEGDEHRRS